MQGGGEKNRGSYRRVAKGMWANIEKTLRTSTATTGGDDLRKKRRRRMRRRITHLGPRTRILRMPVLHGGFQRNNARGDYIANLNFGENKEPIEHTPIHIYAVYIMLSIADFVDLSNLKPQKF